MGKLGDIELPPAHDALGASSPAQPAASLPSPTRSTGPLPPLPRTGQSTGPLPDLDDVFDFAIAETDCAPVRPLTQPLPVFAVESAPPVVTTKGASGVLETLHGAFSSPPPAMVMPSTPPPAIGLPSSPPPAMGMPPVPSGAESALSGIGRALRPAFPLTPGPQRSPMAMAVDSERGAVEATLMGVEGRCSALSRQIRSMLPADTPPVEVELLANGGTPPPLPRRHHEHPADRLRLARSRMLALETVVDDLRCGTIAPAARDAWRVTPIPRRQR